MRQLQNRYKKKNLFIFSFIRMTDQLQQVFLSFASFGAGGGGDNQLDNAKFAKVYLIICS